MISVNWEDAQEYVRWLSRETGEELPAVERVGVGVCGTGGDDDGAVLGGERVGAVPVRERV